MKTTFSINNDKIYSRKYSQTVNVLTKLVAIQQGHIFSYEKVQPRRKYPSIEGLLLRTFPANRNIDTHT